MSEPVSPVVSGGNLTHLSPSLDFFSPVNVTNVMSLLEVVKGEKYSLEVISARMEVVIKKVPVLAGNCFGFIGNRMLEFYGKEAQFLVEEGATPSQVRLSYRFIPLIPCLAG
jgi:3-hydroxyacyl-CoA dehydrogenase